MAGMSTRSCSPNDVLRLDSPARLPLGFGSAEETKHKDQAGGVVDGVGFGSPHDRQGPARWVPRQFIDRRLRTGVGRMQSR